MHFLSTMLWWPGIDLQLARATAKNTIELTFTHPFFFSFLFCNQQGHGIQRWRRDFGIQPWSGKTKSQLGHGRRDLEAGLPLLPLRRTHWSGAVSRSWRWPKRRRNIRAPVLSHVSSVNWHHTFIAFNVLGVDHTVRHKNLDLHATQAASKCVCQGGGGLDRKWPKFMLFPLRETSKRHSVVDPFSLFFWGTQPIPPAGFLRASEGMEESPNWPGDHEERASRNSEQHDCGVELADRGKGQVPESSPNHRLTFPCPKHSPNPLRPPVRWKIDHTRTGQPRWTFFFFDTCAVFCSEMLIHSVKKKKWCVGKNSCLCVWYVTKTTDSHKKNGEKTTKSVVSRSQNWFPPMILFWIRGTLGMHNDVE